MHSNDVINCSVVGGTGDFHFLWECLRVIYVSYWGRPNQIGSLCNLREVVRRVQVDKGVKVFSTGDEFLLHCFQSHLLANICKQLGVENPSDTIPMHGTTLEWLEQTATSIVQNTFFELTVKIINTPFINFSSEQPIITLICVMQSSTRMVITSFDFGSFGSSTSLEVAAKIMLQRLQI